MANVNYDEDYENDNGERSLIVTSSNHRGSSGSRPSPTSYSSLSPHSHTNGGYSSHAPGSPPTTSSNGPANGGYEELFKDSVPCPSCRGLGRVPKGKRVLLLLVFFMNSVSFFLYCHLKGEPRSDKKCHGMPDSSGSRNLYFITRDLGP